MTGLEVAAPRAVLIRPLSHYVAAPTDWLWAGRIPRGELTILAGDGGLGKSTLAAWIASRVTTGEFKGSTGTRAVHVLLGEDDPARVLKLRYRAAGCEMSRVGVITSAARGTSIENNEDEVLSLPDDMPHLGMLVARHLPDLLIVDPLTAYLGGSIDAHRDGGQGGLRSVLGPLQRLASKYGVTVLACAHLNKGSGPAGQRIAGSAGVRNAARNVLLLAPHPEARDSGDDDGRRVLGHEKTNYGKAAPTLDLEVRSAPAVGDDGVAMSQDDGSPATTSVVVMGGESDVDYRDAVASAANGPSADAPVGGRAEAEEFLRAALAAGPMPVKALQSEALDMGIASRTLARARKALGVVASKDATGWSVQLPPASGTLGTDTESPTNTGDRPPTWDEYRAKSAKTATVRGVAALAPLNGSASPYGADE